MSVKISGNDKGEINIEFKENGITHNCIIKTKGIDWVYDSSKVKGEKRFSSMTAVVDQLAYDLKNYDISEIVEKVFNKNVIRLDPEKEPPECKYWMKYKFVQEGPKKDEMIVLKHIPPSYDNPANTHGEQYEFYEYDKNFQQKEKIKIEQIEPNKFICRGKCDHEIDYYKATKILENITGLKENSLVEMNVLVRPEDFVVDDSAPFRCNFSSKEYLDPSSPTFNINPANETPNPTPSISPGPYENEVPIEDPPTPNPTPTPSKGNLGPNAERIIKENCSQLINTYDLLINDPELAPWKDSSLAHVGYGCIRSLSFWRFFRKIYTLKNISPTTMQRLYFWMRHTNQVVVFLGSYLLPRWIRRIIDGALYSVSFIDRPLFVTENYNYTNYNYNGIDIMNSSVLDLIINIAPWALCIIMAIRAANSKTFKHRRNALPSSKPGRASSPFFLNSHLPGAQPHQPSQKKNKNQKFNPYNLINYPIALIKFVIEMIVKLFRGIGTVCHDLCGDCFCCECCKDPKTLYVSHGDLKKLKSGKKIITSNDPRWKMSAQTAAAVNQTNHWQNGPTRVQSACTSAIPSDCGYTISKKPKSSHNSSHNSRYSSPYQYK
ncbi:MAG: hypothetical protein LBR15_00670 [Methanobrevibacter sp.]|jgi:hypothetical protein|nr:hypothetical protein [Candidatus Methanovirga australis]